jgi:hypothetical protein
MLRGAPPAAGPTGTVGRARATPELHGAVRSGTAGCGLYRNHWPCTGRGSYASTHAHLGTAGRETLWGSRAASGPEELLDSERELRVVAFTSRHRLPRDHFGIARLGADLRVYACLSRHRRTRTSGTLRYMISYMISEVSDIKLISYDIDVYDIIRL